MKCFWIILWVLEEIRKTQVFFPLSLDPETIENQIIYFDPKKLVGLFAMATPFRRRGYHGAYLVGIGELRRYTISGNRQDAD